ncbi:hypothetical protein GGI12_003799, partial [Dipsacomyces acuminosporus]
VLEELTIDVDAAASPVNSSQDGPICTVPEDLSHIINGYKSFSAKPRSLSSNTMPIIGSHKSLVSFLSSAGSKKGDGRAAFSPYTGSLSKPSNDNDGKGAGYADAPPALPATMGSPTSITLNVRYVAKDIWRKVTFPPGITVTQARDICMLRLNIWQQTLPQGEEGGEPGRGGEVRSSADTKKEGPQALPGISPPSGGAVGFLGAGNQSSQNQFREQYGLFWTSAGHWLEPDEMLGTYPLRKGEVLEVQHIVDFIALQPHEFKFSYTEGHIYYLHTDDADSNWQLFWAVLRCRVLRLYKRKGQEEADVEINLARPFRLTDQQGHSWPRSSSKTGAGTPATGTDTTPNINSLIEALSNSHIGGDGGILVVQVQAQSTRQTHSFCTCNSYDYDIWRRTLRHTLSAGSTGALGGGAGGMGVGGGCGASMSCSISGTSNNSRGGALHSIQSSDTSIAPNGPHAGNSNNNNGGGGGGSNNNNNGLGSEGAYQAVGSPLSSAMSPQIHPAASEASATSVPARYEGNVNRKTPNGYGFRRRYCVLMPKVLYGFLYEDMCKGVADDQLMEHCEFAVALDPASMTIEAIPWNGRYLLRVFGPKPNSLKDLPGATSLQTTEDSRIHCTDILATAAQAAIEQYGSTFGLLPDSKELVRLMVDEHDEGHKWAVNFNSIAGLQITGQSKVIMSARRRSTLTESKSHANFKSPAPEFHSINTRRNTSVAQDECSSPTDTTYSSNASICKQQSLSEFIVSQMSPIAGHQQRPPNALQSPQQNCESSTRKESDASSSVSGSSASAKAPKWIPLSIDKYVKEEEERKRQGPTAGYESVADLPVPATSSSSPQAVLRNKASNVGIGDHHHGGRSPAKFHWFKRRGSTSK